MNASLISDSKQEPWWSTCQYPKLHYKRSVKPSSNSRFMSAVSLVVPLSKIYHSSHLVVAGLQTSLSTGRPGSQGLQGSAPSVASSPASLQQLPARAPSSCGTTIPALEPVTLCNCSCCCYSRKPLQQPQTESSDATNISHSLCVGTAADGSTTAAR
jgi:hypothetical protein